ncbi:hypothetical protein HNR44_002210 [Geomicrobium halophilum]|uniref:Uncharacterized protein n=1 Tax=Geomicrobium halophilum TaxID=549000 RepID=A0A841PN01_9BACL|nr:hypothetical protein [Geomicrobium halophilum]MBB6450227.1 hypothetical protein [Geomicrobium halophilum]
MGKLFKSFHKESSWPPVFHPKSSGKDDEADLGNKINLDSYQPEMTG